MRIGILVLLLAVAGCQALGLGASPERTLTEVESAVAERDWLRFTRYVDVDALLESYVDQALSAAEPGDVYFVERLKPPLLGQLRDTLRAGVESGVLRWGELWMHWELPGAALPLSYAGRGSSRTEGDVGLTQFHFDLAEPDTSIAVGLMMERRDRDWVIVDVDRLSPVLAIALSAHELVMKRQWVRTNLLLLASQEETYFADHSRYTYDWIALSLAESEDVTVQVLHADNESWAAQASHRDFPGEGCAIFYGPSSGLTTPGGLPVEQPGEVVCDAMNGSGN